jgi:hypothetical protein
MFAILIESWYLKEERREVDARLKEWRLLAAIP